MAPRIAKALVCLPLFGCAAAGPPENALVKHEGAAIAIGQKKCSQSQTEALRNDWSGEKWKASFDPGGGYWWVFKSVSFYPPGGPPAIGLRVLVSAMSGDSTSCDLEYMTEQ